LIFDLLNLNHFYYLLLLVRLPTLPTLHTNNGVSGGIEGLPTKAKELLLYFGGVSRAVAWAVGL
jgi:hypothetical protein